MNEGRKWFWVKGHAYKVSLWAGKGLQVNDHA
jgi:hypothetical protein